MRKSKMKRDKLLARIKKVQSRLSTNKKRLSKLRNQLFELEGEKRYTAGDIFVQELDKRGREWKLASARSLSGWALRFVCTDSLNWRDKGNQQDIILDIPSSFDGSFSIKELERATRGFDFRPLPKDIVEKEYKKTKVTVNCECLSSSYDVVCCLCGDKGFYTEYVYEKELEQKR